MPRKAAPTIAKVVLKAAQAAEKAVAAAEVELSKQHRLLLNHSPMKKGDVVLVNAGASHSMKPMTVTRVEISTRFGKGYGFIAYGLVNRADGTPGKFHGVARRELKEAK